MVVHFSLHSEYPYIGNAIKITQRMEHSRRWLNFWDSGLWNFLSPQQGGRGVLLTHFDQNLVLCTTSWYFCVTSTYFFHFPPRVSCSNWVIKFAKSNFWSPAEDGMHILLCLVCEHSKQFCIPHHFHVFGLLPHQALGGFISMDKPNFSQNSKFCNNLFKF